MMNTQFPNLVHSLILAIALVIANGPVEAQEGPEVWRSDIVPVPFFVVDRDNNLIEPGVTEPGTALYDRRSYTDQVEAGLPPVPITASDGHHVTWAEFSAVDGRIWVTCNGHGTRVSMLLSNLIPNGVYTIWNVTFEEPGFNGEFSADATTPNLTGIGPAGPSDGSAASFRASATGHAKVTVVTPPGELGVIGEIGKCAPMDEFEWHVVGLYHYDHQTHGSDLGPAGTMAEQFAFVFKQ